MERENLAWRRPVQVPSPCGQMKGKGLLPVVTQNHSNCRHLILGRPSHESSSSEGYAHHSAFVCSSGSSHLPVQKGLHLCTATKCSLRRWGCKAGSVQSLETGLLGCCWMGTEPRANPMTLLVLVLQRSQYTAQPAWPASDSL